MKSQDGDNMFTVIGSIIGVIIGLITVITNKVTLGTLIGLDSFLVHTIIMFSFISFGAFAGIVIDMIIDKIK